MAGNHSLLRLNTVVVCQADLAISLYTQNCPLIYRFNRSTDSKYEEGRKTED